MMALADIDLESGMRLIESGQTKSVEGETPAKQFSDGTRRLWSLQLGTDLQLPVWNYHWDNGERHVELARPDAIPELPRRLTNLMSRRRATLSAWGALRVMTIRDIEFDHNDWPASRKTTESVMLTRCDERRWQQAKSRYALRIGTKEEVLGADGRDRSELCATFNEADRIGPVWMYVVTRILPTVTDLGVLPDDR